MVSFCGFFLYLVEILFLLEAFCSTFTLFTCSFVNLELMKLFYCILSLIALFTTITLIFIGISSNYFALIIIFIFLFENLMIFNFSFMSTYRFFMTNLWITFVFVIHCFLLFCLECYFIFVIIIFIQFWVVLFGFLVFILILMIFTIFILFIYLLFSLVFLILHYTTFNSIWFAIKFINFFIVDFYF